MQLGVSFTAGSETTISVDKRDMPYFCIFCSQMTNQCEVGFKSDVDVDVNYSLPNQK